MKVVTRAAFAQREPVRREGEVQAPAGAEVGIGIQLQGVHAQPPQAHRIGLQRGPQQGAAQLADQAAAAPDAAARLAVETAHCVESFGQCGFCLQCLRQQAFARGGEGEAVGATAEQDGAELSLQRLDLSAKGGVMAVQDSGSGAQGTGARDC